MATRPDLVLLMTDQQRFDQVGYSGLGNFETPNLDRLAERGVIFENAYSASTTCVPARVGLLTGLQPHRVPTQVNRFALREGFWTVARALVQAGYESALIGKMHFFPVHAQHGFQTMRLCEHVDARRTRGPVGDVDDYHDWLLSRGIDDWRVANGGETGSPGSNPRFPYAPELHPTGWICEEATSFLERRHRDRPLFLVVSFPQPHGPYNTPEPYASMYSPNDSRLPGSGFEVNANLPPVFREAMSQYGKRKTLRVDTNEKQLRRFLATIRGLVKHIDDVVGEIVARLDLRNTVVFVTSDHGSYSGHRGLLRKIPWIPFDDLARVPFVASGCDVVAGRRVTELVQSSDLALTCLDYAGVDPPSQLHFDSRSLKPFLGRQDPPRGTDRPVFCATNMGWPMVRRGTHKYIVHRGSQTAVLFDLGFDPAESVDLAQAPDHRRLADELSRLVSQELAKTVVDSPGL